MSYQELRMYFEQFHLELISKLQLRAAICMWQRAGSRM